MKKKCLFLLICAYPLLASAQFSRTEIIGNKQMVTENRHTSTFSHIRVIGLNAILENSNSSSLQITAESNITEFVKSEVSGDTLLLSINAPFALREIAVPSVKIPFQNIKSISGSVSNILLNSPVNSDSLLVRLQINSSIVGELNSKNLHLKLLNSKATLSGSASKTTAWLRTLSDFNGSSLSVQKMDIRAKTLSTAKVNVSESINATLLADSKISNSGIATPTITQGTVDQLSFSFLKLKDGVPDINDFL
jgi:hypothetical protein